MKTFTHAEIRGAILRAAATIEGRPDLWNWREVKVPPCGSPGCAIGHIGFELGFPHTAVGFQACAHVIARDAMDFYRRTDICNFTTPEQVVGRLRAYADRYFPEQRPAVAEDRQLVRWSDCAWAPMGVRA